MNVIRDILRWLEVANRVNCVRQNLEAGRTDNMVEEIDAICEEFKPF